MVLKQELHEASKKMKLLQTFVFIFIVLLFGIPIHIAMFHVGGKVSVVILASVSIVVMSLAAWFNFWRNSERSKWEWN